MEAKLIKTIDGYELFTQGFLKGSTNHGLIDSLNVEEGSIRYKLSLKNCQAIELGYDLDELAKDRFGNSSHHTNNRCSFKEGFQKALELMGDKKFTEEDIAKAIDFGVHIEAGNIDVDYKNYKSKENQFLNSIKQNEWDVTFNPEEKDSEGCLILKRL